MRHKRGMTRTPRVLAVVTSASRYATGRPTGLWIGELTHFWEVLHQAGIPLDVVSMEGGAVPIDPVSEGILGGDRGPTRRFHDDPARHGSLMRSERLDQADLREVDAIYFAGGHGAMFDFRRSAAIADAVRRVRAQGGLVSAVCHGVAALVDLVDERGRPLIADQPVTGYSNLEERLALRWNEVPFKLEDALIERGAAYRRSAMPFVPHVVDGQGIYTGQNPQSTHRLATRVVEVLRARRS